MKQLQITDTEILSLLINGTYRVDLETGKVYGRLGVEIVQESSGRYSEYLSVRVKTRGTRRKVQVSLLVWMAGTLSQKPMTWEIHHRDGNTHNNAFTNLLCLHPTDHRKLHYLEESELPF